MKKRLTAFLLAALLLLTACGGRTKPKRGEEQNTIYTPPSLQTGHAESAAAKTYFDEVWRGDVAYADMEYEHYEPAWFDEYTAPILRMARKGGSAEDFVEADYDLYDELCYVHTLLTLMELQQSAHPEDEAITEELLYIEEVYYTVNDAYWDAMHTLAVSPYAALLEEAYSDSTIEWFQVYDGTDEEELARYNQENALINEYYRLMAQDEPDTEAVGEVFLKLVALRQAEAAAYGYDSYADYAYESIFYKDYTPEDARTVWAGAKESFVPLMRRYGYDLMEKTLLLQSSSRLDCGSEAVLNALDTVLPQLSAELYTAFQYMLDYGLYDIAYDTEKVNTGYTTRMYYVNEPFLFNAPYDEFYDYTDTFHEFGHFANAFYTEGDLLFGVSDNDLCELQSQGMEILFIHYYDDIFGSYADIARDYVLMNMVYSVLDGALQDEFQQRVYGEKELTAEKLSAIYAELYEAYGYEPYEGYETEWMGIAHTFEYPFYYISYAVSALGALELYELAQSDWEAAVDKYLRVCAMDTELYYYSEALEEAGLGDVFEKETYRSVADALEKSFR